MTIEPRFTPITASDATENLAELYDDHHTTSVSFIRDDMGEWYARTNVQGPGFTEARWWTVNGEMLPAVLDGIVAGAEARIQP